MFTKTFGATVDDPENDVADEDDNYWSGTVNGFAWEIRVEDDLFVAVFSAVGTDTD